MTNHKTVFEFLFAFIIAIVVIIVSYLVGVTIFNTYHEIFNVDKQRTPVGITIKDIVKETDDSLYLRTTIYRIDTTYNEVIVNPKKKRL